MVNLREELRLQQDSEDKKRYSDISPQKGDTSPHATDGPLVCVFILCYCSKVGGCGHLLCIRQQE